MNSESSESLAFDVYYLLNPSNLASMIRSFDCEYVLRCLVLRVDPECTPDLNQPGDRVYQHIHSCLALEELWEQKFILKDTSLSLTSGNTEHFLDLPFSESAYLLLQNGCRILATAVSTEYLQLLNFADMPLG
jgi:hypothetical protein